ncbi:hypothetical protein [Gemmobacter sp. 24YEA27]|nr:hypothetical protein [Gemmobacter sp. 24YEA27]
MTAITLDSISRDYGSGVFGVRDVSLTIGEGEFMVLLGLRAAENPRRSE